MSRALWACLLLAATPPAWSACATPGMTVAGALAENVGLFDASGKFLKEEPKAQLVPGAPVLDCDESLGLVKVALASGAEVWLDRAELKITLPAGAQAQKVCVQAASSRATDHTEPAVAGIDPKAPKDCVAPATP